MQSMKKRMTDEEVKNCAFDILLWFDDFCKTNRISWWLCGGTLLGAVRHKGFIPWDDDIDIMLPRGEYERLSVLLPKEGRYRFLNSNNTKNFPYAYGKIIDAMTEKEESISSKYQCIGVDIDVFPIDNFPVSIGESNSLCRKIEVTQSMMYRLFSRFGKKQNWKRTVIHNLIALCWRFLDLSGITPISFYTNRIQMLAQKYNSNETGYKGILIIAHYGIKERNQSSVYSDSVEVEFEGHKFPAPVGYKTYLQQLYGSNYMQLPPREKQVTHHSFVAYWK